MRVIGNSLLVLSSLAAILAIYTAVNMPAAYSNFSQEPEDLYLLVFWCVTLIGISTLWLNGGMKIAKNRSISRVQSISTVLSIIF